MIILLMSDITEEGVVATLEAIHPGEEAIHVVFPLGPGESQGGVTLVVTHLDQGEALGEATHLDQGEAQEEATLAATHQCLGRVPGEAVLTVYLEAPVGVSPVHLRSVDDPDPMIVTRQGATRATVLPLDLGLFQNLPVRGLLHHT